MPGAERPPHLAGVSRTRALSAVRAYLARAGVEAAQQDSRLLLFAACGFDSTALLRDPDEPLSVEEGERYAALAARRSAGEPASRIVGRRPFWTLDLIVRPGVLDPRADSEALVRVALRGTQALMAAPARILDLGCGSGALLCALLSEFENSFGIGVDLSDEACLATSANLSACALADRAAVVCGAWGAALAGPFDLIVSNPPYIATGDLAGLESEVRDHDPRLALDGGPDGLDAYRDLFRQAPSLLSPRGVLALELGAAQARQVDDLATAAGLAKVDQEADLGGRERAAAFRKSGDRT